MKRQALSLVLLAIAASPWVLGGVARAEDAPAGATAPAHKSLIGTRCKEDAAKLCAGIEPGGGKLAKCLRSHDADLSEPCKAALAAAADAKPGAVAAAKGAPAEPTAAPTPPDGPAGGMAAPAGGPGMAGHHGGGGAGMMGHSMEWGPMKEMRKSCADDVAKYCKDVAPGHGRIAVCLNEHPNDLAPACKKMVDQVMPMMNAPMETHADCAADVQKLCSDVPAGAGRVGFCLGEHSAELSPACKKHIADMKAHWRSRGLGQGQGHAHAAMMGGAGGAPGMTKPAAPPMAPPAPVPAK